jgi:hypothetical protein
VAVVRSRSLARFKSGAHTEYHRQTIPHLVAVTKRGGTPVEKKLLSDSHIDRHSSVQNRNGVEKIQQCNFVNSRPETTLP